MKEHIQKRILERVTFYETKTEGKPVRFIRSMSEKEDPRLQALRMACDGNESCGSYRDCLAMYHILASEVLNTEGDGFLSDYSIRRALALDYELKEQKICMEMLVKCGLILRSQGSEGGIVQYAILDEQCARLKRNMECVRNRLYKGKSRHKEDEATCGQYQKAQETLTVADVLKYGIDGVLAKLLCTKQGQPEPEAVPDIQTEEMEPERKTCEPPLELSGFEEKLETFRKKDFRKSKTNTPPTPTDDLPWTKRADSVLTQCEQEETEQPEASPQGEIYARENRRYWRDCVE